VAVSPRRFSRDWVRAGSGARTAHLATLAGGGLLILALDRNRWFLYDEWAFPALIHPLAVHGDWVRFLLAPYINHWIGLPNLVWEALYRAFGFRAYLPYLLPALAAHLAIVAMVRVVLLRAGVRPWPATGASLLVLLTGAGAGNLAFGWQIEFLGPVMFGLGQLLLTDHDGPPDLRDAAGLLLGFLGLMCSGVAPAFVFLAGANLALRGRWTAAAITVLPLAAVFLAWYAAFGHRDLAGQPPPDLSAVRLALLPPFIWKGLTASLEGVAGMPGIGAVAAPAIVVAAVLLRLPPRAPGSSLPWAMALAAVVFFAVTGFGRAANGPQFAAESRYLYVGIVLLLPLVAWLADRTARTPAGAAIWAGVLVWALVANVGAMYAFIHDQTIRGEGLRAAVYKVVDDPNLASADPHQPITADGAMWLTVGLIRQMRDEGSL
jgi:hypothetical protein